ncbi:MAG: isoprenyl transferase [Desulfuromonadales bacterium]|jgi:undecaprenyl diphosphate synthase|nr:isoprenyl transferase [Desulfuromonadales bacterium]
MQIPTHLAIIMDGNGRWAEQRRLPRILGHRKGVESVQTVVDQCMELGIRYLTLYAFSSENWGRPQEEVEALMGLLGSFLKKELSQLQKRGIRLMAVGELDRLPKAISKILKDIIKKTAGNDRMVLNLALSYGSRNELTRAMQALGREIASGKLQAEDLTEADIGAALDTHAIPDPDLLIRTSGEMRISNFLLWQVAYSELYFTEALWPDFSREQLLQAIEEYSRRQRRFGLTGAQLRESEIRDGEGRH